MIERIGDAQIYLGNALEVLPTLTEVQHIICDPPYESTVHDGRATDRSNYRRDGGPALRAIDFASIDAIRQPFTDLCAGLAKGWFIAFCTLEGAGRWEDAIRATALRYKRACVWVKPDATPQMNGECPAVGAESFVCAWGGGGRARWNGGGKRGVYTHAVKPPDRHGGHPTEKPRRLMREIICDFTKPGDLVVDPFMGSGTTGVAALQEGRRFVGIELRPDYFEVARRRLELTVAQGELFSVA